VRFPAGAPPEAGASFGTSVGANYREASRGRSKAEFISKIGDCLKEIEETEYWLELLEDSGCISRFGDVRPA
jgi:four helix bundle protein